MRLLQASLLFMLLGGCALLKPAITPEQPFVEQRMRFRPDRPGKLTYSVCNAKDAVGHCTAQVIHEVDLADSAKRAEFNSLNFVCDVGGERYKVCKDAAQLCQVTYTKSCVLFFCNSTEVIAKRLDATMDLERLVDADARCFQKDHYPFDPEN